MRAACMSAAWDSARNATILATITSDDSDSAIGPAMDAIMALIAYDECAYMLDSDLGELGILVKFGDKRAILLLLACEVFNMEKENV